MKKYKNTDLLVIEEDKSIYLNKLLIERQNVSEEDVERLKQKHRERLRVVISMEKTDEPNVLKLLNETIVKIDFALQEIWGFKQNSNYHRWWEVPKCKCPPMDNRDRYGTKYRITVDNCPIHGKL